MLLKVTGWLSCRLSLRMVYLFSHDQIQVMPLQQEDQGNAALSFPSHLMGGMVSVPLLVMFVSLTWWRWRLPGVSFVNLLPVSDELWNLWNPLPNFSCNNLLRYSSTYFFISLWPCGFPFYSVRCSPLILFTYLWEPLQAGFWVLW